MLEVVKENCLGRITSFQSGCLDLSTPEILYISGKGVEPPSFARTFISDGSCPPEGAKNVIDLLPSRFFDRAPRLDTGIDPGFRGAGPAQSEYEKDLPTVFSSIEFGTAGDIVPVGDALLLSREPKRFAHFFSNLRERLGPGKLVYAPGAADPLNLALLCYFGIDLVDPYGTMVRSSLGQVIMNGRIIQSGSEELERVVGIGKNPDHGAILKHNLRQLESELAIVRDAIREGTLRHLVELRARHAAWMVEALRFADLEEYRSFERWTPTFGGPFLASSKESLWRPEIRRYRERIETRYLPPTSPEVLLLLPCSARKPYSLSKTHRMFREAVRNSGIASSVQEVIVTSPLGIVPRELETVYPAQQYDIPVTGHWDEDEKNIIKHLLRWLLSRRKYSRIVAHIDDEWEFLGEMLEKAGAVHTGGESVTRKENLEKLTETLRSFGDDIPKPGWNQRTAEEIRSMASYQFGEAYEFLLEGAEVRGGYPMVRVLKGGVQLCSLVPDKGSLSLTLDGGKALAGSGKFGVEIDDFVPKTNVFAIGVTSASDEIRSGDEVYVHHGGEVRAVGTARMNGASMVVLKRGEAVHIRHHG
jgi:archaeosine synthase